MTRLETLALRAAACVALLCACPSEPGMARGDGSREAGTGAPMAPVMAPVARVDSEKGWLDLIAQRPLAHSMREGELVVDLGRRSAAKFVALGGEHAWKLGHAVDTKMAGLVSGRTASLDLPLDGPLLPALHPESEDETPGLAMAVTLKALGPKQNVTVLWDERPLANLRVSETWSRRTFSLPTELVHSGENRLRFHFSKVFDWNSETPAETAEGEGREGSPEPGKEVDSIRAAAAISTVEIGTLEAIRAGEPRTGGYELRRGGESLYLPGESGLVYYLVPPPRARLGISLRGRGGLEVLASTDDDHRNGRPPARLDQRPLREAGNKADIDLSGYGGVPTRLEIRITGANPEDGARVDALDIQVERSRPVDKRDRKARDLFVLAIEGARPEELYGSLGPWERREYEVLSDFMRESLVFERVYAQGAAAVPSHAGWLSSVAPSVHLTVNGTYVSESQELLPERLARAGYFNSAITANGDLNAERGLTQGFAKVVNLDGRTSRERAAPRLMEALLEEYRARPTPRFAYVVASDTQAPFDPPREEMTGIEVPESAPAPHLTHMWVGRVRVGKVVPDDAQVRYVHALYQGELAVIDRALGSLISELEQANKLDDSVIVVMGVHGEEFLEHGSAGHGHSLYEEAIRVPLAIRAPSLLAPGRVDDPVDLLDLAPTLSDLLGVEASEKWQGESLVPLIDDPHPPPRLLVSSRGDGSRAALIGDYKLILGPGSSIASQQFFDLGKDPGETTPLRQAGREGVAVRMLINALSLQLADEKRWKRARWGNGANLERAYALDHGI